VAAAHDADDPVETDGSAAERPALWAEVGIDPVEIALPRGVGYTLRAYRPSTEVTPTDATQREDDEFPDRSRPNEIDEEEESVRAALAAEFGDDEEEDDGSARRRGDQDDADLDPDDNPTSDEDDESGADGDDRADAERSDADDADDDEEDEEEDGDKEEEDDEAPEEVPVFLGHGGRLYLFRTPEGLVDFIHSGAEHDLSQVDSWAELAERVTVDDVVPLPEDQYELDLVVDNLRGSHETWDADLVIQAGEVARDIGYALQLPSVIESLAPGSPLDDLDEVLRTTAEGGVGGFFAKRKLRKIGAQAAPLGWRTIIGKISSVVDWRD
jgi:hypothetical protein